jgi:hypothetical protein
MARFVKLTLAGPPGPSRGDVLVNIDAVWFAVEAAGKEHTVLTFGSTDGDRLTVAEDLEHVNSALNSRDQRG